MPQRHSNSYPDFLRYSIAFTPLPVMGDPRYNTTNQISVPKALELVRNSETGEVHPSVDATLERAIGTLWNRIKADPNRYVMTKDEFAVFNYFRARFSGDETARKAVGRFWNNHKGEGSHTNGSESS